MKYAYTASIENGCNWDENTCLNAAVNGLLDCLKYAHTASIENGCPWVENMCAIAAENGHLECLKYACDNKCPGYEKHTSILQKSI